MKSIAFGKRLIEVRKAKKLSQDELAKRLELHGAVIGRYERDEVKPSIEMAAALADALEISLDYLVGNTDLLLDKNIMKRVQDIQLLTSEEKSHLFALMDAFLRDAKTKQAYAS